MVCVKLRAKLSEFLQLKVQYLFKHSLLASSHPPCFAPPPPSSQKNCDFLTTAWPQAVPKKELSSGCTDLSPGTELGTCS